jgi:hypothetical protein
MIHSGQGPNSLASGPVFKFCLPLRTVSSPWTAAGLLCLCVFECFCSVWILMMATWRDCLGEQGWHIYANFLYVGQLQILTGFLAFSLSCLIFTFISHMENLSHTSEGAASLGNNISTSRSSPNSYHGLVSTYFSSISFATFYPNSS